VGGRHPASALRFPVIWQLGEREVPVVDPAVTRQPGAAHPLARHLSDFLTDLGNANASAHTIQDYRGDLLQFAAHDDGEIGDLSAGPVRAYLAEIAGLAPATRKRKRAAVASFCRWAVRHDLLTANPMDKIDAIKVSRALPRPAPAADIARVLAAICSRRPRKDVPLDRLRDRVLFETAYACGARAAEACGLYVEDLDLRLDDEHVRIHGKGGTVRTVLLDDRGYVALLRLYLARAGYTAGPLFRASINGVGRAVVLRRGPPPLGGLLPRGRGRPGDPPAAPRPRPRHRAQLRGVHRGRPPPPRPRQHRDHPAVRQNCWTTRSPTPTGPVSELTGLALSRLNAIACTW